MTDHVLGCPCLLSRLICCNTAIALGARSLAGPYAAAEWAGSDHRLLEVQLDFSLGAPAGDSGAPAVDGLGARPASFWDSAEYRAVPGAVSATLDTPATPGPNLPSTLRIVREQMSRDVPYLATSKRLLSVSRLMEDKLAHAFSGGPEARPAGGAAAEAAPPVTTGSGAGMSSPGAHPTGASPHGPGGAGCVLAASDHLAVRLSRYGRFAADVRDTLRTQEAAGALIRWSNGERPGGPGVGGSVAAAVVLAPGYSGLASANRALELVLAILIHCAERNLLRRVAPWRARRVHACSRPQCADAQSAFAAAALAAQSGGGTDSAAMTAARALLTLELGRCHRITVRTKPAAALNAAWQAKDTKAAADAASALRGRSTPKINPPDRMELADPLTGQVSMTSSKTETVHMLAPMVIGLFAGAPTPESDAQVAKDRALLARSTGALMVERATPGWTRPTSGPGAPITAAELAHARGSMRRGTVLIDHLSMRADMLLEAGDEVLEYLAAVYDVYFLEGQVHPALRLAIIALGAKPKNTSVTKFGRWRPIGGLAILFRFFELVLHIRVLRENKRLGHGPRLNLGFSAHHSADHVHIVRAALLAAMVATLMWAVSIGVDCSSAFTRARPDGIRGLQLRRGLPASLIRATGGLAHGARVAVSPQLGGQRVAVPSEDSKQQGGHTSGPDYNETSEAACARMRARFASWQGARSVAQAVWVTGGGARLRLGERVGVVPPSPVVAYADDINVASAPSAAAIIDSLLVVSAELATENQVLQPAKTEITLICRPGVTAVEAARRALELADELEAEQTRRLQAGQQRVLPAHCPVLIHTTSLGITLDHTLSPRRTHQANYHQAGRALNDLIAGEVGPFLLLPGAASLVMNMYVDSIRTRHLAAIGPPTHEQDISGYERLQRGVAAWTFGLRVPLPAGSPVGPGGRLGIPELDPRVLTAHVAREAGALPVGPTAERRVLKLFGKLFCSPAHYSLELRNDVALAAYKKEKIMRIQAKYV